MADTTDKKNITDTTRRKKSLSLFVNRFFGWISFLLLLVVLAAGYFLVIKDEYRQLTQSQNDLAAAGQEIKLLSAQKQALTGNPAVYFSPAEERLFNLALPKSFDVSSIITQFTSLAKNVGFTVNSINVADGSVVSGNPGVPNKVSLTLDVVGGDYNAWKRLLAALESSAMIADVTSISFNSQKGIYSLNLSTYYYPDN